MDPISTTLCPRARVTQAAGARPGVAKPMSQFSSLGAGFTDPEISPTDRQECRDRPTGEISGLARGFASDRGGASCQIVREGLRAAEDCRTPKRFARSGGVRKGASPAAAHARQPKERSRVVPGAASSWFSKSLGRCFLWQSVLLASAARSRSVWSAAVHRRFSNTVVGDVPHKAVLKHRTPDALRYQTRPCTGSFRARSVSQPPLG